MDKRFVSPNPSPLTHADIEAAADSLALSTAHVKAVISVESSGSGFLKSGRPKLLFEAHHFSRLTGRRFDGDHPEISCRRWNRDLYVGGEAEYERLRRAIALDETAALQSASWGLFQVMGFNFQACRFRSVFDFVDAHVESEAKQLEAALGFIRSKGLVRALIERDWAGFARVYNGPSFKKNRYDEKLASAYRRAGGV